MAEPLDSTDDIGSNSGVSPDIYLEFVREQTLDQVEKDKIVGRMRARSKRAKAAGVDLDADVLVAKLAKLDPDTRHARLQNVQKQASWRGLTMFKPGVDPNAEQSDIWPEPTPDIKQGHRDAVIYSDGFNSRKAGGERQDNVQMAGSSEYAKWDEGWLDCDREIGLREKTPAKIASSERRPGKPADAPKEAAETKPAKDSKKPAAKPAGKKPRAATQSPFIN